MSDSYASPQCQLNQIGKELFVFRQPRPINRVLASVVLLVVFVSQTQAQDQHTDGAVESKIPTKTEIVNAFQFVENIIKKGDEDIHYYVYHGKKVKKTGLVLYIQGSDPSPQFCYKKMDGKYRPWGFLKPDFRNIPEGYIYVVVEKPGLAGLFDADNVEVPKLYFEKNSLNNSVFRINAVIDELVDQQQFDRVIVYGHSEGAPIGAKLATANKKITHLGFWAGNALPDYFDFILEERIRVHKGETTVAEAQASINKTIAGFKKIARNPEDTSGGGYTNKRWWSYSEPPINNLLKLEIPIYVQVATNDQSAPIESTYLIPLEFERMGKSNLTYRVLVNGDHGFVVSLPNGKKENKWSEIFQDFLKWAQ